MKARGLAAAAALAVVASVSAVVASADSSLVLQPDASSGKATFVMYRTDKTNDCANWGRYARFHVGANAISIRRGLVQFDLHGIPAGARIASATLSLFHPDTLRGSGVVEVHRVTQAWLEGTGVNTCTGDGATWTTPWATPGGSFDPTAAASLAKSAGDAPAWDSWDVTGLVQGWASGAYPNDGVLLKLSDESFSPCTTVTNCNYWAYASDDWTDAAYRPKLTIAFG
jgi:Disaggregatase related repeat